MDQQTSILEAYYNVLEAKEKAPAKYASLDTLVALETALKAYRTPNEIVEETEKALREVFSDVGKRDAREKNIMQEVTGDRVSIQELLEQFAVEAAKILSSKVSATEMLQHYGIEVHKIKSVILPPDEGNRESGKGPVMEQKETPDSANKLGLLLTMLREYGIFPEDIYAVTGILNPGQVRPETYVYLYIPAVNKVVLINHAYGEATFVYDGYVDEQWFVERSKSLIKQVPEVTKVAFDYSDPENRKMKMKMLLIIAWNTERSETPTQRLVLKRRLELLGKDVFSVQKKYEAYVKDCPDYWLPMTYRSLVFQLWWYRECGVSGEYVVLLVGWDRERIKNYENLRRQLSGETEVEKIEKFKIYCRSLDGFSEEILFSDIAYLKFIEDHPDYVLPISRSWFVFKLWWKMKTSNREYLIFLREGNKEKIKNYEDEYYKQKERKNAPQEEKRETYRNYLYSLDWLDIEFHFASEYRYATFIKKNTTYDLPKTYSGLISNLWWNAEKYGLLGAYVKLLLSWSSEEIKAYEDKQEILYAMSDVQILEMAQAKSTQFKLMVDWLPDFTEEERLSITKYELYLESHTDCGLPLTYASFVHQLGWNPLYGISTDYVKLLWEGDKEKIKNYEEKYDKERTMSTHEKRKIKKETAGVLVESWLAKLPHLTQDILESSRAYENYLKKYPSDVLPQSHTWLVGALWWVRTISVSRSYIQLLCYGTWEEVVQYETHQKLEKKSKQNSTKEYKEYLMLDREIKQSNAKTILDWWMETLPHFDEKVFLSALHYENYMKAYQNSNMPLTFSWLIGMLGGIQKYGHRSAYLKVLWQGSREQVRAYEERVENPSLITAEEKQADEEIYKKELEAQKLQKRQETREIILSIPSLTRDILMSWNKYTIYVQTHPEYSLPKSYAWLIDRLWWNRSVYGVGGAYLRVLLDGTNGEIKQYEENNEKVQS